MASGYTDCKCRDCFDTAVSNDVNNPDFCSACVYAGCEEDSECSREDSSQEDYDNLGDDLELGCIQCEKDGCCSAKVCCRPDQV